MAPRATEAIAFIDFVKYNVSLADFTKLFLT